MKSKVLTGITLAFILALVALFVTPEYRQGEASLAGRQARDFDFTLEGRPATLSGLRGKVVVVNFWATWCPPCVEETPSLNHLQERLVPRGGMVLGVSVDEDPAAYERFLQDYHITFPTYRDPSRQISASYGTFIYPDTYIIDRRGRIARKIIGAQDWDSPEYAVYFDSLLREK